MVIRDQEAIHHDSSNVTMETGKPALASVPVHIGSVTAQAEKRTPIQAPLTAVYIHTVPALPVQPYIQPPATVREPSTFHLSVPPLYSKETLPFVTLHLAGGLQPQPRPSLAAVAPTAKPKSAGKHVCPHCGRDCMKPSVLEKHLRCHTGERPYPCTTCGVSFKTQSNLYKHRRTQAHARLSSESEQSSLDSMSSSRETCSSSLSLDEHSEELGSVEKNDMPPTTEGSSPASPTQAPPVQPRGSDSEQTHGHTETKRTDETKDDKQTTESSKRPSAVSRHLPLQRQEATLFSKQWGSSVSRGKSQSHESTDSGFSESGDHYPSPSSVLPDHGMNSLTESNEKPLEGAPTPSEKDRSDQEPRHTAKKREQKMLAEHISKLISENTAVVEDKKLENVRPRKTVLSKQGSIDLPMPYTFKDSFHFDMKINPTQNIGLKKHNRPSLPTQCSSTMEHAPLTRSNSLPFSITLMQPERGSPASPYQGDYVTIVRRGSSGQINPTDLARKPVNQHSSSHRPLVRQTAVDCNHATDGLFANSSVEEACTSSLSCDGDVGDVCGEPNIRKFQRKKAQKFAYNKWYMYGNGTFKKLYGSNKNPDNGSFKGRKGSTNPQPEGLHSRGPEVQQEDVTTSRSTVSFKHSEAAAGRPAARLSLVSSVDSLQRSLLNSADGSMKAPLRRNLSLSLLPVLTTGSVAGHKPELSRTEAGRCSDVSEHADSSWRLCGAHVPSDRKKQRTDDKTASSIDMETDPNPPPHPPPSVVCSAPQDETNPKHSALQGAVFLPYILNPNVPPISASPASSIPAAAKSTFLPKYQLKLPNSRDVDFNASPQVLSTETVRPEASCAPSDQTPASATAYGERGENPGASLLVQAGESSRMKTLTSTPEQLLSPGVVTSSHGHSSTSSLAAVQRQVATTTKTTSCLCDYSGGLCSALLQSAADSVPTPLPPPLAPAAGRFSSTTPTNQMLAATVAAVGPDLPPAHTRLSAASDSANPENRALVCSSAPVPPCPVVPLDQPAQNVFHVHTADLQICLQIISDEQLALIAPQIERPSGTGLSQTRDVQATNPESETRRSPTREAGDDGGDHGQSEHQKTDGRGTWPNMERTSSVSEQFLKWEQAVSLPDQHLSEASAVCPSQQTHGHMAAQPPSSEGSFTSASLRAGTLGGLQTLENEQHLRLNHAAEDMRVSQRFCDQNKLSMSSFSTGTENQNGTKNDPPAQSHGDQFSEGSLKTSGDVLSDRDSWTESGEGLRRTSGGVWIHESGESKTPSQTPVCCSPQGEPAFNRSQSLSKVRRSYAPPSSPGEPLHDGTSSDQSETSLGLVTSQSSYILGRRAEDPAAVWTGVQDPPAGTSLVQHPAHKEQQIQEHAGTSQPENSDWRPKQREVEAETIHQTSEEQGAAVVTGEEKNQGVKTNRTSESCCRCVVPPDVTKLQRGGTKVEVDSFKSSSLSKQHLQTQSECPPAAPPQDQSTSHSPALPASSIHASLLNPALEVNQLRSPLKTWGISSTQDQPVQVFHQSVSSGHVQVQLSERQNVLSKPNSNFHSLSHHSKNQTYGSMAAQQGHTSAGSYESAVGSYDFLPSESSKNTSFSPDFRTQTSSQFTHISLAGKTPAGLTENNQNTGPSSNPFTYLEFDEKQNPISTTPYEQTGPTSHCGRPDMTNKYQPMFMVGSFHGYQTPECLSGAVRPVPICQDFTEDTSSSDDEGKLIIEL